MMMQALLLLSLLAPAQAGRRDQPVAMPPPKPPPLEYPQVGEEATPGSLWSEVQARRLMGMDGSARQVGDLVTVKVAERSTTSLNAGTRTERESSVNAELVALLGAERSLKKAHKGLEEGIKIGATSGTGFDGAGATSRDAELSATVTCQVLEVLPNGNLRIWGYKTIRVNRETQYVVIDGITRPRDIQMDNTVGFELLARPRLEVTGSGVIADKQGPGWGQRLLDFLWPF